jgi:hypothetical protein
MNKNIYSIVIAFCCVNFHAIAATDYDTIYLEGKKAWYFYGDVISVFCNLRRQNLTYLYDNDPKARDAMFLIDNLIDDNIDPNSICTPLQVMGVKKEYVTMYKIHFLQQLSGKYYPPGIKMGLDSQIPDNVMFVVDRKTRMLQYMKSTNFEYSDNQQMNLQIIGKDIFDIVKIHMNDIARYGGYKYIPSSK